MQTQITGAAKHVIVALLCIGTSGCFTSQLHQETYRWEATHPPLRSYVSGSGELIIESAESRAANPPAPEDWRYVVVSRREMAKLIRQERKKQPAVEVPVVLIPDGTPHRYVTRTDRDNGAAEYDPDVLASAGPPRDIPPGRGVDDMILYESGDLRARIPNEGLAYRVVETGHTSEFDVLVVPMVVGDVVSSPFQLVAVVTVLGVVGIAMLGYGSIQ